MNSIKIPREIKEEANRIIEGFNDKTFGKKSGIAYHAVFRGSFLYLYRIEGENDGPVARLRYNGKMDNWNFAIFRWSSERYDPDEFLFPGSEHLNGTLEGAMKAGNKAYPVDYKPSQKEILNFFRGLFGS